MHTESNESEIFVQTFHMLKNSLTLCQSRLHAVSETFVRHKFGSGSIFCVFASIVSILIGMGEEYEKKLIKRQMNISDSMCKELKPD